NSTVTRQVTPRYTPYQPYALPISTRSRAAGPVRQARPPSWNRSIRRALLFLPLFFIVFSLVNKHSAIEVRFLSSLAYSALFVPLTYVMDRTAYRTYLRRSGQQPPAKR